MKIALVHPRQSQSGGTERYLNQMASYLCERGDEVTVLCRSFEFAPHARAQMVRLRSLAPGGAWRLWNFAASLDRHLRHNRYDLVYDLGRTWTHDVVRLGGGCHATYRQLAHDQRLVPWWKAPLGGALKHRVTLALEGRGLAAGAYRRVVVNAQMVKRDVVARYGVPTERVAVVYNGVDLTRFDRARRAAVAARLRSELGFNATDVVVVFVGSGFGRKGLGEWLEAIAIARRERPMLRGLVVGYDSTIQLYRRKTQELGLVGSVQFLSSRPDPEHSYSAGDLFALPTHYDPFANATLEALACGLPVITSESNGAAEILTPATGAVIAAGTAMVASLARELITWCDRGRLDAARGAARALAEQHPQERTMRESAAVLDAVWREKSEAAPGHGWQVGTGLPMSAV